MGSWQCSLPSCSKNAAGLVPRGFQQLFILLSIVAAIKVDYAVEAFAMSVDRVPELAPCGSMFFNSRGCSKQKVWPPSRKTLTSLEVCFTYRRHRSSVLIRSSKRDTDPDEIDFVVRFLDQATLLLSAPLLLPGSTTPIPTGVVLALLITFVLTSPQQGLFALLFFALYFGLGLLVVVGDGPEEVSGDDNKPTASTQVCLFALVSSILSAGLLSPEDAVPSDEMSGTPTSILGVVLVTLASLLLRNRLASPKPTSDNDAINNHDQELLDLWDIQFHNRKTNPKK